MIPSKAAFSPGLVILVPGNSMDDEVYSIGKPNFQTLCVMYDRVPVLTQTKFSID